MGMWRRVVVAAACVWLAGVAWAADAGTGGTLAEVVKRLGAIREQLGSRDFAVREAGQKELDKIPATEVEPVRLLAAGEKDAEVKARLEARIAAMELYTLLHPPAISVDVTDGSLQEVTDAINKNMGSVPLVEPQTSRGGRLTSNAKFILHVDQKPFWQVFEQLNRQNPLTISRVTVPSSGDASFGLAALPPTGVPRAYGFTDTFAFLIGAIQHPGAERWQVNVVFFSDPRVRIASYSLKLQLDKLTDQDGHDLLPLLDTAWDMGTDMTQPVITGSSIAVFRAAPEVQRFREIKGSVLLKLLEKEQVIQFDLKGPAPAPVSTSCGTFSLEKIANGDWVLNVSPAVDHPPGADGAVPASPPRVSIRTFNAEGNLVRTSRVSLDSHAPVKVSLPAGPVGGKVVVAWSEKVRDYVLPISMQNVDAIDNSTGPDLFNSNPR